MPPSPDTAKERANTTVVPEEVRSIADQFAPERAAIDTPDPADRRDRAQREAALDSQLKEQVNEHCSRMSGRNLIEATERMLRDPNLDPKTAEALRSGLEEVNKNTQPLRDILFTALSESDQKRLTSLEQMTPEQRAKAQENLGALLESASDAQLKELYDRFGVKSDPRAQSRQEQLDALLKSDLLERSFKDPRLTIELASILETSGKLSPQMSGLLGELNQKARDSMSQLRDTVSKQFIRLIHQYLEEFAEAHEAQAPTSERLSIDIETKITWPLYVTFLQALERSADGKIPFTLGNPNEEIVKGLAEQERALRERDKKEEHEEQEFLETKQALIREIQKIARANPELFNRLAGMAAEQLTFLDPLSVAHRVPEYQNPLA